jgi:uncharacterized membrane protein YozB (DUF420 family)
MLLASYALKRKRKLFLHGATMLIAFVLHTVSIIAVMVPSFVSLEGAFVPVDFYNITSIAAIVHGTSGVLTEILAFWIVANWRLQSSLEPCAKRKNIMRPTLFLWVLSLLLGILLYLRLYTAFLT